jgi:sialate O-acetylesterase
MIYIFYLRIMHVIIIISIPFLSGENNAFYNKDLYNCTFPAMIDDWRKKFSSSGGTDKLFPFGFVQVILCLGRQGFIC